MKSTEEIKDIIETILQGTDLFLVDLKVSPDNSIEVYIDSLKGINVDSCVTLSKQLDAKLDRDNRFECRNWLPLQSNPAIREKPGKPSGGETAKRGKITGNLKIPFHHGNRN